MIILTKNNETIEIPNYDDLANKPKINGVTLEGNKTSAELGIEVDTSDFYTKSESDNRFQPKGNYQPAGNYLTSIPSEYVTESELNTTLTNKNYATKSEIPTVPSNVSAFNNDAGYITENALNGYASENWVTENYQPKGDYQPAGDYLTSIPSEYITETELNEALAGLDGNGIPYAVIDGYSTSGFSITHGNWADVYSAIMNKSAYVIYVRSTDQNKTYSIADDISIFSSAQMISLAVTLLVANKNVTYRAFNITSDGTVELSLQETYTIQQQLVSGESIKTINGNSILGSGNLTIGSGTTDLSNYYTKTEIDTQIGNINTILENIIG